MRSRGSSIRLTVLPTYRRQHLAGEQLELLRPPAERVEHDVLDALVERVDPRADPLGDLLRLAEQVVGLPVLEVHPRIRPEVRHGALRLLALLQHPDEIGVDAPDRLRIAPGLPGEPLHLL